MKRKTDKPESPDEIDRRADLTILSVCLHKKGKELQEILDTVGCPMSEFKALTEKYSRVLARYSEEFKNGNIDELTGLIKDS